MKPIEPFVDGAIYDLYRWYGIVPDVLLHVEDKKELSEKMLVYLLDSIGKIP